MLIRSLVTAITFGALLATSPGWSQQRLSMEELLSVYDTSELLGQRFSRLSDTSCPSGWSTMVAGVGACTDYNGSTLLAQVQLEDERVVAAWSGQLFGERNSAVGFWRAARDILLGNGCSMSDESIDAPLGTGVHTYLSTWNCGTQAYKLVRVEAPGVYSVRLETTL
jgi:hypothetical protein